MGTCQSLRKRDEQDKALTLFCFICHPESHGYQSLSIALAINVSCSISLYDMIAMIVPGSVIECAVLHLNGVDAYQANESVIFWVTFLILAYLIGIVDELLSGMFFSPIRNNQYLLADLENNQWSSRCLFSKIKFFTFCVAQQIADEFTRLFKSTDSGKNSSLSVKKYYTAYYFAQSHRIGEHIGIMEAQLAFMRNMVIPLILCCFIQTSIYFWIVASLLVILLIFAIPMRVVKIHKCIFEDCAFLSQIPSKN